MSVNITFLTHWPFPPATLMLPLLNHPFDQWMVTLVTFLMTTPVLILVPPFLMTTPMLILVPPFLKCQSETIHAKPEAEVLLNFL